jgi:hypothetical protein
MWSGVHALICPFLFCGYMVGELFNSLLHDLLIQDFLAICVNWCAATDWICNKQMPLPVGLQEQRMHLEYLCTIFEYVFFPLPSIKRKDKLTGTVEERGHFRTCHQQATGLPVTSDSWPDNRSHTLRVTTWLTWPQDQETSTDSPPPCHPKEPSYYQAEGEKTENSRMSPSQMTNRMTVHYANFDS